MKQTNIKITFLLLTFLNIIDVRQYKYIYKYIQPFLLLFHWFLLITIKL